MVIAALSQNQPSLAIGNVVGSTISNILGAFGLGLIFCHEVPAFDNSSKRYTLVLMLVATVFVTFTSSGVMNRAVGRIMVASFGLYLASIGWAIYSGKIGPPEGSDGEILDNDEDIDREFNPQVQVVATGGNQMNVEPTEEQSLLNGRTSEIPIKRAHHNDKDRSLIFHLSQLLIGFLGLSLSGYILSHTAASLSDELQLSGTILGLTVVSFSTTLPEKFVAVMSGSRGHAGILVANTVGSNIFLLTLCAGAVFLGTDRDLAGSLNVFELGVTWSSSVLLCLAVFFNASRWVGALFVLLYLGFLVLEFTLFRR